MSYYIIIILKKKQLGLIARIKILKKLSRAEKHGNLKIDFKFSKLDRFNMATAFKFT